MGRVSPAGENGTDSPADGAEHVRPQQGRVPRDRRAPVVADDDGLLRAERADEGDVVGDVAQHPVVVDAGGADERP